MNAISLFSSSGIGDLGLRANNVKTLVANELVPERANLFSRNFPNTKMICGDIWENVYAITSEYRRIDECCPTLLLATPPCQGMSSNGMGSILNDIRKGVRYEDDPRNRLVIPAVKIIKQLRPLWVIFENVANMGNTVILDDNGKPINIIDYIHEHLKDEYEGNASVVECADYGVPQSRKRLITILSRDPKAKAHFNRHGSFLPDKTHSKEHELGRRSWITLRDSISHLPPLDALPGKNVDASYNPWHKVPLLDEKKYFWVSNTREGDTAFNNQCINSSCRYQGNAKHGASRNHEGINKFNNDTPLYCEKCGSLLPRPWVEDKVTGEKRLMKGYVSAYKRMRWDEPASTLTQNFQFACSDNKLHPEQNRVLSLLEGLILQTIHRYDFHFECNGRAVSDGLVRDTIGESVPPLVTDIIIKHILSIAH